MHSAAVPPLTNPSHAATAMSSTPITPMHVSLERSSLVDVVLKTHLIGLVNHAQSKKITKTDADTENLFRAGFAANASPHKTESERRAAVNSIRPKRLPK